MRLAMLVMLCGCLHLTLAAGQEKKEAPKPIGPVEAAKKVDEQVVVLMEVKSAKLTKSACFLNSEDDFKDKKNFTIYIDKDALAKFKEAKIDDPAAHFKGKTIEAKGKVMLYKDRPEIKLAGPAEIKIVEKKKE
jgi:DNA/RNA endonuclease YhcR with UshA esterase domain